LALITRARDYLVEHEYRPLFHLLCALAIIAAACFLFHRNFGGHGTLMASDMTWPNTLARLRFETTNTWYPFGSVPIPGDLQWFFWIYPSSTIAQLLGFSAAGYMLLVFLGTFSLAGISMYALAYSTIRQLDLKKAAGYAPYVGAVFAGLVYMYNPWSLHYLRPYFAYPIYALMPLLFLVMVKTFEKPSAPRIILFALFVTIANTTYNLVWFVGLIGSYLLFFLLKNRLKRSALLAAAKVVFGTAVLYLFVNALWVTPYLGALAVGKKFLPFYSPSLSKSMVIGASARSTTSSNLRLLTIWSWSADRLPGGHFTQALLFIIPVLVVISLILVYRRNKRNATVNYWAAVAVIALLLASGANGLIKGQFLWFVFKAPGSGVFGWLLRTPERFLFFVAPFFALMLGILVSRLLVANPGRELSAQGRRSLQGVLRSLREIGEGPEKTPPRVGDLSPAQTAVHIEKSAEWRTFWNSLVIAVLVIAAVLASLYPKARIFADNTFGVTHVPADYQKAYDFMNKTPGEPRVAWMPFYPPSNFVYKWAPNKTVSWYSVMTSNPGLSSVHEVMNPDSYYQWMQDLYLTKGIPDISLRPSGIMVKKDIMSRLFWPFSTKYVILDRAVTGYDFGGNFAVEKSLTEDYFTRYLHVYSTNQHPEYVWAAGVTLKANSFFDNLSVMQEMPPGAVNGLAFTDGDSFFGGKADIAEKYGTTDINDYIQVINQNPGFEQVDEVGNPLQWARYYKVPRIRITTDQKVKASGKRSLRVENSNTKSFTIGWVISDEQPVARGGVYGIRTKVKYSNANWTTVTVEGYNSQKKKWQQLVLCPTIRSGTADWKEYYCSFWLPPQITKIRPVLGAGWVRNPALGKAITWFDDVELFHINNDLFNRLGARPPQPQVTFKKISSEKYKVSVRGARAPFVLVQSEAYDHLWVAELPGGKRVDPVPLYASINGYPIEKTGDFDLVLEYEPQKFVNFGFLITFLTLLACAVYLFYRWRKPRVAAAAARGETPRTLRSTAVQMKPWFRRTFLHPDGSTREERREIQATERPPDGKRKYLERVPRIGKGRTKQ
jgi:hypothetical protein